jgi:sigma-E factor negative regulatory protein RseC
LNPIDNSFDSFPVTEVRGTVTSLDGDHAFVRIMGEGCGRCHEPGGCGGSNLTQVFCLSPKIYRVLNPSQAKPGEEVVVVIRDRTLFRGAIAGYGLPLLGLFVGAALGLEFGEVGSMIGAGCGLLVSLRVQRTRLLQDISLGTDSEPCIK